MLQIKSLNEEGYLGMWDEENKDSNKKQQSF